MIKFGEVWEQKLNDRAWLNDNSPALQQPVANKDRVDWGQRDLDVLDHP